jgi:small-conductance mechanosensitive channel
MQQVHRAADWLNDLPPPLDRGLIALLAVALALLVHALVVAIVGRTARRTATRLDDLLLARLRTPTRWFVAWAALSAAQPVEGLPHGWQVAWARAAGLIGPALGGWAVVALLGAGLDIVEERADVSVADNLRARRRRTRASILHRIGVFAIVVVTLCVMMMSIPSVRAIGVTFVASAGLAGLALGAAAQPALKNLVAGVQMAFTEPIRLDDVVIIEGEWGRIEEIRLTYVVVRIWDDRRLVVPVSKFLEDSFQNWTRSSSELLGQVLWYVDATADVERIREAVGVAVRADPRWDGRFYNLQVTDMKEGGAVELRALMTAKDASLAFDLRCAVREAVLAFLRDEMPEALLRLRHRADDPGLTAAPSPPAVPAGRG